MNFYQNRFKMSKYSFTLIQHTPIIHHLGLESWSGLQSKAITPMLNRFLAERNTGYKGEEAEKAFRNKFRVACGICRDKVWNAGACVLSQDEDGETGKCRAGKEGGCEFAGWFRNKKELENIAFNYNLSFECKVDETASYLGKTMMQDRAHVLYENRQVHGAISCSSKGLQKFIVDSLSEFFILTGLGYNSSKGFGCFTLKESTENDIKKVLFKYFNSDKEEENSDKIVFCHNIDELEISTLCTTHLVSFCKKEEELSIPNGSSKEEFQRLRDIINSKYWGYELNGEWKFKDKIIVEHPTNILFKDTSHHQKEISEKALNDTNYYFSSLEQIITDHWKLLKSGKNKPYKKSLLWQYFCGQYGNTTGWEKRFIKEALKIDHEQDFKLLKRNLRENNGEMRFETDPPHPTFYQFFRVLLGLAEKYEYRLLDRKWINNKQEITISVKPENKDIERIPSPVQFKVFFNTIFIIVDSVNEILRDARFEFIYKKNALNFKGFSRLGVEIPLHGLKDCFVEILTNTKKYEAGHPLCDKYQQLTVQESK